MKTKEIISEVKLPATLRSILYNKGYKFLGAGVEHSVWQGPDNYVYKILPPRFIKEETAKELHFGSLSPEDLYMTASQRCFISWVEYCQQHQSNNFLPFFDDWQPFTHKFIRDDKTYYYMYIQCRTERLFQLSLEWSRALQELAHDITVGKLPKDRLYDRLKYDLYDQRVYEVISHMGAKETGIFYDTIVEIEQIAKTNSYRLDLHGDNFMLGSDGHIVINDPFFIRYSNTSTLGTNYFNMS